MKRILALALVALLWSVPAPAETVIVNGVVVSGGTTDSGPDPSWFPIVGKTISGGSITITSSQRNITLFGEGDVADELVDILGASEGQMVTMWRKEGVGYSITISTSGNFHLQNGQEFILGTDYDNITLIHKGGNIWTEQGGRVNAN